MRKLYIILLLSLIFLSLFSYEFKVLPAGGNNIKWPNINIYRDTTFNLYYTVIGNNVNLALCLQSPANVINIPIIVSDAVISYLNEEVKYRTLEPIKVKGTSNPVNIYRKKII